MSELSKYNTPPIKGSLKNCEILKNIAIPKIMPRSTGGALQYSVESVELDYCIILSQDCDLERDYIQYQADGGTELRHIILCELMECKPELDAKIAEKLSIKKSYLKAKLPQNPVDRYGFLESGSSECPELLADFRLIYGVEPNFLYSQLSVDNAKRIIQLNSPYKEHFAQRFFFYQNRVALPEQHLST